jgi:putative inorganic carbon (HCO3(-)) transporter
MDGAQGGSSFLRGRGALWALLLLVALTAAVVATETYIFAAVPFAALIVFWALYHLDSLILAVLALTPLSVSLESSDFKLALSLPGEVMLAGLTLFAFIRFLHQGRLPWPILNQALTQVILLQLGWMAFTILFSEMPLVSFKAVLSRVWFIVPMYFMLGTAMEQPWVRKLIFPFYAFSLGIAAIWTLSVHSQYGFSKETSTWVMFPFYKEHTMYGMALAFVYPWSIWALWRKQSLVWRFIHLGLFLLLTVALVFSYTRAAWLSLVAAGAVYLVFAWRISARQLLLIALVAASSLWLTQDQWMRIFTKNDTVSSDNFGEHIQSASNISTDASNLERLNRWASALRMWQDRPHVGWGLNTYQFQYAPFQNSSQLTFISTNGGVMGNAHSEYIGPLAELGWPGLVWVVLLIAMIFRTGVGAYWRLPPGTDRSLVLVALLGQVTYWVHGLLNNFLDLDKGAVLVWMSAALIAWAARSGAGIRG